MRLRPVFGTFITATALMLATQANADPLDPDPSFGQSGTVVGGYVSTMTAISTSRGRTYLAGGDLGAGSYDHYLIVELRGKHGGAIQRQSGEIEVAANYPVVQDVIRRNHRVFTVGWLTKYNSKNDQTRSLYGYVAAFPATLKGYLKWGTDRFINPDKPGLQRLKEVPFGSVTGGVVDRQGRVLVTGRLDGQTAVLRLTRDGRIDTSFGRSGLATIRVGSGSSPRDIAVHGTTTLVVGNTTVNGNKQGFATQITGNGYRDRTFSDDGVRLIGKPRTLVTAVDTAVAGRWLVGYEHGKRAGVTKIGATGDLIGSFGRHGRASLRCTRPGGHHVIDALATDHKNGQLNRIALATTCQRDGDHRPLASIWRPGGHPITSLRPDATARLPWRVRTRDLTYGWRGRLIGLSGHADLTRLR